MAINADPYESNPTLRNSLVLCSIGTCTTSNGNGTCHIGTQRGCTFR